MPQRERRRTKRHPLEITVEITIGRDQLFQATRDLSREGAFLVRAIPYKVGTKANLKILLPDGGAPIVCRGIVVNIPDNTEVGMGLKFLDISEQDQRRIEIMGVGMNPDGETII